MGSLKVLLMSALHIRDDARCPLVIGTSHRLFRDSMLAVLMNRSLTPDAASMFRSYEDTDHESSIEFRDREDMKEGDDCLREILGESKVRSINQSALTSLEILYSGDMPSRAPSSSVVACDSTERKQTACDRIKRSTVTGKPEEQRFYCSSTDRVRLIAQTIEAMVGDAAVQTYQLPTLVHQHLLRLAPQTVVGYVNDWVAEPVHRLGALTSVFVSSFLHDPIPGVYVTPDGSGLGGESKREDRARISKKLLVNLISCRYAVYAVLTSALSQMAVPQDIWQGMLYEGAYAVVTGAPIASGGAAFTKAWTRARKGRLHMYRQLESVVTSLTSQLAGKSQTTPELEDAIQIGSRLHHWATDSKLATRVRPAIREDRRSWRIATARRLTHAVYGRKLLLHGHFREAERQSREQPGWAYMLVHSHADYITQSIVRITGVSQFSAVPITDLSGNARTLLAIHESLWLIYSTFASIYYSRPDRARDGASYAYADALAQTEVWQRLSYVPSIGRLIFSSDAMVRMSGFVILREWCGMSVSGLLLNERAIQCASKIVDVVRTFSVSVTGTCAYLIKPLLAFMPLDRLRLVTSSNGIDIVSRMPECSKFKDLTDVALWEHILAMFKKYFDHPKLLFELVAMCVYDVSNKKPNDNIPDPDRESRSVLDPGHIADQRRFTRPAQFGVTSCSHEGCGGRMTSFMMNAIQGLEESRYRLSADGNSKSPWAATEAGGISSGFDHSSAQCLQQSIYPFGVVNGGAGGTRHVYAADGFFVWPPVVDEHLMVSADWQLFELNYESLCKPGLYEGINRLRAVDPSRIKAKVRYTTTTSSTPEPARPQQQQRMTFEAPHGTPVAVPPGTPVTVSVTATTTFTQSYQTPFQPTPMSKPPPSLASHPSSSASSLLTSDSLSSLSSSLKSLPTPSTGSHGSFSRPNPAYVIPGHSHDDETSDA